MYTFTFEESKHYDNNIENSKYAETCVVCGKGIKDTSKVNYLHMNTDWNVVRNDIDEADVEKLTGADSQGCFPIGNDCAKKIPKSFLIPPGLL